MHGERGELERGDTVEAAKLADHVGLIEVAGLEGDRAPVGAGSAEVEGLVEAGEPTEELRALAGVLEEEAFDLARAEVVPGAERPDREAGASEGACELVDEVVSRRGAGAGEVMEQKGFGDIGHLLWGCAGESVFELDESGTEDGVGGVGVVRDMWGGDAEERAKSGRPQVNGEGPEMAGEEEVFTAAGVGADEDRARGKVGGAGADVAYAVAVSKVELEEAVAACGERAIELAAKFVVAEGVGPDVGDEQRAVAEWRGPGSSELGREGRIVCGR